MSRASANDSNYLSLSLTLLINTSNKIKLNQLNTCLHCCINMKLLFCLVVLCTLLNIGDCALCRGRIEVELSPHVDQTGGRRRLYIVPNLYANRCCPNDEHYEGLVKGKEQTV